MVLVLDDEHLESLQCSKCRKYLSVFPVKNHSSRDVTCGRCSGSDDDEGSSARSFLYELVAEEFLFKCVNRYEGCRKLLRADETEAHEQDCIGEVFLCPKCEDGVNRSALELIWHYRFQHPSSYLKKNSFDVKPLSEDIMLYVQDDVIVFISIRCELNVLYLGAKTLTEVNATQAFTISRGPLWEKTESKLCKTVKDYNNDYHIFNLDVVESIKVIFNLDLSKRGRLYDISVPGTSKGIATNPVGNVDRIQSKKNSVASVSNENTFTIQLATKFKTKLGYRLNDSGTALLNQNGHEIDLTCSNCKQVIRLPLFTCTKSKHRICYNCRAWCGICDSSVVSSGSDYLLHKINFHLKFPCRWKCGKYFSVTSDDSYLRTHENSCKLKIVKCPKCLFQMYLSDFILMEIHLLDNHQILNYCDDYDVELIKRYIDGAQKGELYFLLHDKCCYLKWSECINKNYNYSNRQSYQYELNFGLLDNEPNVKLDVIYQNQKCPNINVVRVSYNYINTCLPYINFNYNK